MTSDQIVSVLLSAARSAVAATLGERATIVWPMIEGEARAAAEEAASELAALLEAPEPKKEPIDPKNTPKVREAIEAATGKREIPEEGFQIIGAKRDLNTRGQGTEFYRMVYRNKGWQYVSAERVSNEKYPSGTFRSSTVYGEVYPGEIVASHDRGGPLAAAWLVVGEGHGPGRALGNSWGFAIKFHKRRSGLLRFSLPDGQTIDLPNPRA